MGGNERRKIQKRENEEEWRLASILLAFLIIILLNFTNATIKSNTNLQKYKKKKEMQIK